MLMRYPVLCLLIIMLSLDSYADSWQNLAKGIEYQELNNNKVSLWSHIHVFRINLKENTLNLITAKDVSKKYASVNEFASHGNALIAINGGFFDKQFNPLGLRISNFKQLNPIKRISWWGILYTNNQRASLKNYRQFNRSRGINFAIQSGPRLIVDGSIPSLKPGVAERSAIGIDENNNIIILVTDNAVMSTTKLATLMKSAPLNCVEALNLDGGSSSQLYASIGSFNLNVHGFSDVSDSITVTPNN